MARILVVQSEPTERVGMTELLALGGHQVLHQESSDHTEIWVRSGAVDLVIVDVSPHEPQLLKNLVLLHHRFPAAKIIVIVDSECADTVNLRALGSVLGAIRRFRKPFSVNQLLTIIDECLEANRQPAFAS